MILRSGTILAFISFIFAAPLFAQQPTVMYNGRAAVASEVLVRLRSNDSDAMTRVRRAAAGAQFEELSTGLGLHLVRSGNNNLAGLIQALSNHPDVLYVEPNYIVQAVATQPNDPSFSALWGMTQISAPNAWDIAKGGTSAVIGIVDTGIDYSHPDLSPNVWSAPAAFTVNLMGTLVTCPAGSHGFNAINGSCDPYDDNSHGSHVSGTAGAAGNNSVGVTGVNWTAKMMGLKFLGPSGSGTTAAAVSAIEFAIQVKAKFAGTATPVDIRVLSNSWGGTGVSQSLLDEINKASSNEILFVAAAGNSAANNDTTGFYPADFSTVALNVIAVAATDVGDTLASFSNYGVQTVQLGAPGVGIYSTVPGNAYASFSGTSMATPHVAGAALLVASACPSLNTLALKAAILNNVDSVPALALKTVTGGRLNVNKAVRSCATTSTLKATYLGVTGQDFTGAGSHLTSDGVPDWHFQLTGLRGIPARVRISSVPGGVWESPYNGTNWNVYTQLGSSSGDLWIEPWSTPGFHVKVFYSDGTTDESDAIDGSPNSPPPSTLKASYMGTPGQDYVGQGNQLTANGHPDWNIHLQGMRSTPIKVRITSTAGGAWEAPFNGSNWIILVQTDSSGNGDLWFEPWSTSGFHVKVWYADGTTDETDSVDGVLIPSTLQASFLGITGEDFVGTLNQTSADGVPDWHIQLQGLRSSPVKVRITSSPGGAWENPFNGGNWIIRVQLGSSANADLWFEPWSTASFHVKVWFADGTTDEVDAH